MKNKSFAMIVMSGLLVASFAYVAPAMADDDGIPMGTVLADNSSSSGTTQSTDNSSTDNSSTDDNSGNSSDQGSPDTATGDDDY